MWLKPFQKIIRWDLEDHERDGKYDQTIIVLQSGQLEVLLQAKDNCVRNVNAKGKMIVRRSACNRIRKIPTGLRTREAT
jgi:hypothetical protein